MARQGTAAIANIQAVLELVDTKKLAEAADLLVAAERVLLVGSLSSTAFIDYVGYMANMALENWHVTGRGGASISACLVALKRRDIVLVVAKRPYARRSVEAVRVARDAGAHVIAVTDGVQSPVIAHASISFVVPTESPNFFSSHAATIVLLESLIGMVVRRSGKKAQARIAVVENANREQGEYWEL